MRRTLPTVLTLAIAIAAGALYFGGARLAERIYRVSASSGSESLFLGTHDMAELETVAVVHKAVFPHDYFLEDTNFYVLLDRVRRADAPAHEALSPRELDHFDAVNLAQSLGLATAPGQPGFVVVTTTLRYGYDLSQLEAHLRSALDHAEGEDRQAVTIAIPPARLLSQETEDLSRESYPYSPVFLDADGWQAVATFVSERLRRTDPDQQIIAQATSTGIELVEALTARRVRLIAPQED
ncbi:MAG: hypothetical protein ACOCYB_00035 [Alkalispirochaeta sp.]